MIGQRHPHTKVWNQDIDFNKLPVSIRDSFLGHHATKKIYRAGTVLIRVVSLGNNSFSGAFCLKPFYFEHIKKYALMRKISLQAAIQETLAVLTKFSPNPEVAVSITLGKDFYGFEGQAASQTDYLNKQSFSGGCVQIFIPNLSNEHSNKFKLYQRF